MTREEARQIWLDRDSKIFLCARGIKGRVTRTGYDRRYGEYFVYGYQLDNPEKAWQSVNPTEYEG